MSKYHKALGRENILFVREKIEELYNKKDHMLRLYVLLYEYLKAKNVSYWLQYHRQPLEIISEKANEEFGCLVRLKKEVSKYKELNEFLEIIDSYLYYSNIGNQFIERGLN